MSRKGNCYDNAFIESFWSTLKYELVYHQRFATYAAARTAIFDYIETFYNRTRLHSSLAYRSPIAACEKTGWQVHAYCLMSNHFHLVVETPRANLIEGMRWLLGTYTMRFNRRHKLSGHLFAGRYKSLLIDGATPGYLRTVCDYVT